MDWLDALLGRRQAPEDVVERLTTKGLFRVDSETVELSDRTTVQQWLRQLTRERRQQVVVHRPWGVVAAVADGRSPVSVVLSDGDHSWSAAVPGGEEGQHLTPEQVEHIVLDALTSPSRPSWPEWQSLL